MSDADSEDDAADIGEDNVHSGKDDDVDICRGLLAFGPDSPFFKHDLAMQDERLSKLAKNLKEVNGSLEWRKTAMCELKNLFFIPRFLIWPKSGWIAMHKYPSVPRISSLLSRHTTGERQSFYLKHHCQSVCVFYQTRDIRLLHDQKSRLSVWK